ncbi:MAG TPA: response regulator transcription factor [Opitutaceae bacterium]|nr:response regulator transcription factor [Opitutaceae bacterium]
MKHPPIRILIADDDPTSRAVLATVLRKNDHEVLEVADGAEAWAILQQRDPPRLAILDWMMPSVDGVEICRRVHARASDQPTYLILLTTRCAKGDLPEALHAGADDYVTKPFDPRELLARVGVGSRFVELEDRLAAKVCELQEALAQIKTLRGIVPICASCKRVRDDAGYWRQVEAYVAAHSEATFSHGICPECMAKLYPEYLDDEERKT